MKQSLVALAVFVAFSTNARAEAPQYTKDIAPFLKTYCVECHNAKKAKARINLESYEAMMGAMRKGQKIVVAGEPDKSRLLHTLEGKAKPMPPRKYAHQPKRDEIAPLRAWIADGAKKEEKKEKKPAPPATDEVLPRQLHCAERNVLIGHCPALWSQMLAAAIAFFMISTMSP